MVNSWCQHTAETVASNIDLFRINPWIRLQQICCEDSVLHRFFFDSEFLTKVFNELVAVGVGSLVIAEHSNSSFGQTPGKIAKGLVGVDCFISVTWARAMNKN